MRRRILRWLSVAIPVCLGLAATAVLFLYARRREQETVRLQFHRQTEVLFSDLQRNLEGCLETVYAIGSFYDSSVEVTRREFHTFVTPYFSRRPGIQALEWIPRVPAARRKACEASARADARDETDETARAGLARFAVKRWPSALAPLPSGRQWADQYFPVYFVEPYRGNEAALGIDAGSHPGCLAALRQARDTGRPIAAAGAGLGEHQGAPGDLMIFFPVYAKQSPNETVQQRRSSLLGFVAGVFRVDAIVEDSLKGPNLQGIELQIVDRTAGEPAGQIVYGRRGGVRPAAGGTAGGLYRQMNYDLPGRTWTIQFTAPDGYIAARRGWGAFGLLAAGLLFTGLLGGLLLQLTGRASRVERLVQQRTEQLKRANRSLQQTQQKLADVASKLALPPRSFDPAGRRFRIDEFSLTDLMDCGAAVRGMGVQSGSEQELAEQLVRYFYTQMRDGQGRKAFALVRFFQTRAYAELDPSLKTLCAAALPHPAPDTKCLVLLATAGDREPWNDRSKSAHHQAIPLPSEQAVRRLPMIAQLIKQLGFEVGGVLNPDTRILLRETGTGVFHVAQAEGSPYIPAQQEFVIPFGIKSVVGFGDLLPDGRLFAVIAFSKVFLSPETATLFSHLANSVKMALLAFVEVENKIEAQIVSLDRLLKNHAAIVAQQEAELRTTLAQLARSNHELEMERYLLHSLMDNVPDCIYFKDAQSRFIRVNRSLAKMSGLDDPAEAIGKTDIDFLTGEDARRALDDEQRIMRTGEPVIGLEARQTWAGDREDRWVSITKMPLYDNSGRIVGTFGISRDITELKRGQQLLAQQAEQLARYNEQLIQSNKDLDAFAFSASHDLQAPLRRTKSFCQLLQERYKDKLGPEANEFIDCIVQSNRQMQQLVDGLLQYARAGTKEKCVEPVDCSLVVDEAIQNLEIPIQESGATVTHDALPTVAADRLQLVQLFQNLIGNAIKYRGDRAPEVHLAATVGQDEVTFSVRDNGIGIDPKYAEQIFDVFKRLHGEDQYTGSGIGLATCKRIVERHGGRIWVQSQPGEGSIFRFTIARSQSEGQPV